MKNVKYQKAFDNYANRLMLSNLPAINRQVPFDKQQASKLLFALCKSISEDRRKQMSLKQCDTYAFMIVDLVELFTPREFISIFPITKEFKGAKWGYKDYWDVMDVIENHGWDNRIQSGFKFMMSYLSPEVQNAAVFIMMTISRNVRRKTGHSAIEEFIAQEGGY